MESTQKYITSLITGMPDGAILFPSDFYGIANSENIKKILQRLVKQGLVKRAAKGIYYKPEIHRLFGELHPNAQQIVRMIAEKEKIQIRETGVMALNRLHLSEQVPMNAVYITNGASRRFKIGKLNIQFKKVLPKKLATKGPLSSLIIQALEELDLENMDPDHEKKIRNLLLQESQENLQHDLSIAPLKISNYIHVLLKKVL